LLKITVNWRPKDKDLAQRMEKLLKKAQYSKPLTLAQLSSPPHVAADDYKLMPPTTDPMGIKKPVWTVRLPGSRKDVYVYTQPVATKQSVIYRHKNILYCHSILNGELRWKNDLGGRVTWQNNRERQYPREDILVQDGIVFAPIYKVGATLAAFDEITGRLKWAYGPMVASNRDQANLRFEAAPAGGPMTIYAGYVQDNIEGETHTDSEYGIIAFESTTGRVRWKRAICRLRPGLFTAGFASKRRNRIRSFLSPPLYVQGTVYYCTNAGAIVALDSLSGQIKWIMRYPYYTSIHDATRSIGDLRHAMPRPMLWYGQKPLLVKDDLFMIPVDSAYMFRVNRRTGRVIWKKSKGTGIRGRRTDGGPTHFLGPTSSGDLVFAYSFRNIGKSWAGPREDGGIHLVDPKNGKTIWESGDLVTRATQPVLKYAYGDGNIGFWAFGANGWNYTLTALPFMTSDDKVTLSGYFYSGWPIWEWSTHMVEISLKERKAVARRRYIGGKILSYCHNSIINAHKRIKLLEDIPHKDAKTKTYIGWLKEIKEDTVPVNEHGPFLPFSRITFKRFGTDFELRMGPRVVSMLYDPAKVTRSLASRSDPDGLFAKAELAMADSRLDEAAGLMTQCLNKISSEDADFRAVVNQLLYKAYKRLARSAVRSAQRDAELKNCVGMSQTVGTLSDEIETMFALSEAYQRKGNFMNAARQAQSIVGTYGQYEYPTPSLFAGNLKQLMTTAQGIVDKSIVVGKGTMYSRNLTRSMALMKKSLPLYFSALSPLEKDLTVRAGELASAKLIRLRASSDSFAKQFDKLAETALSGKPPDEQIARLWEFPGTPTSQKVLESLLKSANSQINKAGLGLDEKARLRKELWTLADTARICGLTLPRDLTARLTAPKEMIKPVTLPATMQEKKKNIEEERGTAWLVLERRGQRTEKPDLVFLGGRVKKKFDNKFVLHCRDMGGDKLLWKAQEKRGQVWFDEVRLKGKGDEPGFFEAFVYKKVVVVHGRYDVLAFNLSDGKIKWKYQVPFAFEIKHTEMNGDLLVLAGQSETMVLNLGTDDPRGEVVWQEKEEGGLYTSPYFYGDRLVSVRKLPFNVTVRYRSTGKLIGKLALPDLSLYEEHPLIDKGPKALPIARDGKRLVITDGWYYILVDVEKMKFIWKRLIDESDATSLPAMRIELNGDYLAVIKRNYDVKTIYMLSSKTGNVLWRTDPKNARSPQPIYSMIIRDNKLYGIRPHAGQGFYFVGLDCKTGKDLFRRNEQKGYSGKPEIMLRKVLQGNALVARIKDRQDFELKSFDIKKGKLLHKTKVKAAGNFDEHGRASVTVQNGRMVLLGKNDLRTSH